MKNTIENVKRFAAEVAFVVRLSGSALRTLRRQNHLILTDEQLFRVATFFHEGGFPDEFMNYSPLATDQFWDYWEAGSHQWNLTKIFYQGWGRGPLVAYEKFLFGLLLRKFGISDAELSEVFENECERYYFELPSDEGSDWLFERDDESDCRCGGAGACFECSPSRYVKYDLF